MAKVEIIDSLFQEIQKKFKGEAHKIIDLLETLEDNPKKGTSYHQGQKEKNRFLKICCF